MELLIFHQLLNFNKVPLQLIKISFKSIRRYQIVYLFLFEVQSIFQLFDAIFLVVNDLLQLVELAMQEFRLQDLLFLHGLYLVFKLFVKLFNFLFLLTFVHFVFFIVGIKYLINLDDQGLQQLVHHKCAGDALLVNSLHFEPPVQNVHCLLQVLLEARIGSLVITVSRCDAYMLTHYFSSCQFFIQMDLAFI